MPAPSTSLPRVATSADPELGPATTHITTRPTRRFTIDCRPPTLEQPPCCSYEPLFSYLSRELLLLTISYEGLRRLPSGRRSIRTRPATNLRHSQTRPPGGS